jgi:phenylpropionate dioxygenase-like ring-hydroxylating dioxygenase large terminal subunit
VDVADLSFIVVRTGERQFKAYHNVCLHRGRKLADHGGCGAEAFRCAFHAWTWNIEGELKWYPGAWDFPDVQGENYSLREAQVDTWGGFIFINPDKGARALAEHMGSMPEHFASWPLERRFTLWHVQKTINCNWKVAMEAFLESYHVVQTHPQGMSFMAEHATQYDVFEEGNAHFSRLITPNGVPSKHLKNGTALGALGDAWALLSGLRLDQAGQFPPNITDRASLAAWRRRALAEATKADYSSVPDVLMLDSVQYWLFPNFCPWFGEGAPLSYQFRPNADSADTCYMDIWMLVRAPDTGSPPPAPKMVKLDATQRFEPVIGAIGLIFDQDDFNMPQVQSGLKSWPGDPEGATLARYQEIRIRYFHKVLMKVLSEP